MNRLDPSGAAYYAVIAIALVLVGALLTPGSVGTEERGAILAATITVLLAIGWRLGKTKGGDE